MTKTHTPTEKSKKQRDNTKTPPKILITQRLRTDLGQSVGVTTATQLVWLDRFTGSQPYHSLQKLCNQKDTNPKLVNSKESNAEMTTCCQLTHELFIFSPSTQSSRYLKSKTPNYFV